MLMDMGSRFVPKRGFSNTSETMRVLLIGFEPFGRDAKNSSQETVAAVSCDEFCAVDLVPGILPVSFKKGGDAICELIDNTKPDIVIMLDQSRNSDC